MAGPLDEQGPQRQPTGGFLQEPGQNAPWPAGTPNVEQKVETFSVLELPAAVLEPPVALAGAAEGVAGWLEGITR